MITIGTVPYLNALPLHYSLDARRENLEGETPIPLPPQEKFAAQASREYSRQENARLVSAVPSHLAPMLSRGDCDVALIPVVEHFRGIGAQIVSDACVASSGPVRSVLLFHRVAPGEIRRVALDSSSRTSVALLTVLLKDAFGIAPQFVEAAPNLEEMLGNAAREYSRAQNDRAKATRNANFPLDANAIMPGAPIDAALLIGDPALESAPRAALNGCEVLDLASAWKQLTGLPFVFAAWVTRKDLPPSDTENLSRVLAQARDKGVQNFAAIAREAALSSHISHNEIEIYLRDSIEYTMTESHRAGLEEFRRRVLAHGLA